MAAVAASPIIGHDPRSRSEEAPIHHEPARPRDDASAGALRAGSGSVGARLSRWLGRGLRPSGRRRSKAAASAILALCGSLAGPAIASAEDRTVIESHEEWSGVFGGTKAAFRLRVKPEVPFHGRVDWTFSIGRGTVGRGTAEVDARPGEPGVVDVALEVPPVREGLIVQAKLAAVASSGGRPVPGAALEKVVWVFPRDPFAGRTRWLKDLKITLFDPGGETAEAFEGLGIPFEATRNVDALAEPAEGMLVIGEGASFDEERGLGVAMHAAAARGRPVLCLAPAGGRLSIPGAGDADISAPRALSFRRQEIIAELDKRLDARAWPRDGKVVASTLALRAEGETLAGEVGSDPRGWPWVEILYPERRGRLVVCGFGVVAHWEEGPAPRFLLARIFERMAEMTADRPADDPPTDETRTER